MSLKPLRDRIIIKRLEAEEQTKSGLVVPESAKEQPQEGTVVAVGSGRVMDDGSIKPPEVKKGARVLFGKYSGTEVTVDEEELYILREDEILAIVQS